MAVLVDVALSAGFSFLSSLLKPRRTDTSNDNLPAIQFGQELPRAWGTVLCPATLMFAGAPSLNNPIPVDGKQNSTPEELASYSSFLHTNPVTPNIIAVRINGKVVATNSTALPLTSDIKTTPITDIATGLTKYQQITFRFYSGTQTAADPMHVRNGHPDLVYQNQCYLTVADSLRSVFGGRGATVGVALSDSVASTVAPSASTYGFNDGFATIEYGQVGSSISAALYQTVSNTRVTVPRGFQFWQNLARFDYPGSIAANGAARGAFIFGTLTEFYVKADPGFTTLPAVIASAYGTTVAGTAGVYARVVYPVTVIPTVATTNLIVGKPGEVLRSVTLATAQNAPFYNINAQVYNNVGTPIITILAGEAVFGWNNTIYTSGAATNNTNSAPLGATLNRTSLQNIVTGLLSDTRATFVFTSGFSVPLTGFITTNKDIVTDISNLLAITNRIVYERRDGTLVFSEYPALPASPMAIEPHEHLTAPEFNIEPFETQPEALDFAYLDIDREFDSSTVRVGGDSTRIQSFNVNVTADRGQGLIFATNLLNRIKKQIITGTLHLPPEFNVIEGGDVLLLRKLNPTGEDLTLIVLRVETGADLSVRCEFVNYAAITETPTIQVNSNATSGTAVGDTVLKTFVIDTEARSSRIGLSYYTNNNAQVTRGLLTENSIVTYLSGTVNSISSSGLYKIYSTQPPQVGEEYYIFNTNTGDGSWVRITIATLTSPNNYDLTLVPGLYGSFNFGPGTTGLAIFKIAEESTINDSYVALDLKQAGATFNHSFSSRKRLVEPRLTGYLGYDTYSKFYRRASFSIEDDNLDLGQVLPTKFFKITNITTAVLEIISSSAATFTSTVVARTGQSLQIVECDSLGTAVSGTYVNTYLPN